MSGIRWIQTIALAAALTVAAGSVATATQPSITAGPKAPALRQSLLTRFNNDQSVRQKLVVVAKQHNTELGTKEFDKLDDPAVKDATKEARRVDTDNRQWLKKVVEQHGWPGKTLVGSRGAHAAWLLVQHADRDRAFQKACLNLMLQAPAGEVEPVDIAYLTDRVRLAEGNPQLYGTQVELKDGRWQARIVENPDKLDDRRKQVGLPPLEIYLQMVRNMYGTPSPAATPSKDGKQSDHNKTPAVQPPPQC